VTRVGFVGGTFDPIHVGHIAMAEAAAECAGLDRVLLVPSNLPPHRPPAAAPAADRLAMCRLAAAGHPRLEVSDIELRRPGASYTVDTLRALSEERPGDELYLVLGWDAVRAIREWRSPDDVLRLARLVIVTRPRYAPPSNADLTAAGLDPARAVVCDDRTPDVESTDVRRLIEEGGRLEGVLDPSVEAYLRQRGLYRAVYRPDHNAGHRA
jgi:nicotinate-nucleotide adenylyltransferase